MSERRPVPGRSDYKVFRSLATRWADNDIYGHMNNVVHYGLFDTAVNGWLIDNGLLDPAAGAQIGLVVETGCRYLAELAFPDLVTAGLRVAHLGHHRRARVCVEVPVDVVPAGLRVQVEPLPGAVADEAVAR